MRKGCDSAFRRLPEEPKTRASIGVSPRGPAVPERTAPREESPHVSPYGITVPLPGPLHDQQPLYRELVDLGYTDVWSAEANESDGESECGRGHLTRDVE